MTRNLLSEDDLRSISDAIRAAEVRTTGEIVTIVAMEARSYLLPALVGAGLAAFLIPGIAGPAIGLVSARDLFFVQLLALFALGLPLTIPRLRHALIPAAIKRAAARQLAREQFVRHGLSATRHGTGVLIFVSVAERYVEILADRGIDAKVTQTDWQAIVDAFVADVRADRLADGFRTAIANVGVILARHFPATGRNPDELPNKLFIV